MAKQEFCQLAHTFNPDKHMVAGSYISEKLDGEKAIWDGGVSRGVPAADIPYANTVKDFRLKEQPIATGLWSRTGKVIHAPEWFLETLPKFPLDGELWAGRQNWQQLSSIVSQQVPDDRWNLVTYMVYDSPTWKELLKKRTVKVRNDYSFEVDGYNWLSHQPRSFEPGCSDSWTFELRLKYLQKKIKDGSAKVHEQFELPFKPDAALEMIETFTKSICELGAEGIIIRKRHGIWLTERSWDLLKYKPEQDDEGIVVGYYAGKQTDKGSKLLGMMGALEVEWQGARFKISGFTDKEREFVDSTDFQWCATHPGERVPDWIENQTFPRGSEVTFKYRELSDDGIPKEARYLRKKVSD